MKNLAVFISFLLGTLQLHAQDHKLLIGTYTNKGTSEGIYVYSYDIKTGGTKLLTMTKAVNPSYLDLSKDGQTVYAVNESGKESAVSAFSFNKTSGVLSFLNRKSSEGADPCYVISDEKNVFIANYSGGSIGIFGRNADGSLTDVKQLIRHTGKSVDAKRQSSAHVHQIQFTPDKKYMVVNDLGEDQLYLYRYFAEGGKETLRLKAVVKTTPGSGPRHLAFSPNGKFAYLAHEFTGVIHVYAYRDGSLSKVQEIKSTSPDFSGPIDAADIHVSSDGKFLYETNRGMANTISTYAISSLGTLKHIETISTLGKGPRNFTIDPSGSFLLVAHQYSNEVVVFNRNPKTGRLTDSSKRIKVGAPVCLIFQ